MLQRSLPWKCPLSSSVLDWLGRRMFGWWKRHSMGWCHRHGIGVFIKTMLYPLCAGQGGEAVMEGRFVHSKHKNLWPFMEININTGEEHWVGLMSVYVDDILIAAEKEIAQAAMMAVKKTWAISKVEWASDSPLRYCGFEVVADTCCSACLSRSWWHVGTSRTPCPTRRSKSRKPTKKQREMSIPMTSVLHRCWLEPCFVSQHVPDQIWLLVFLRWAGWWWKNLSRPSRSGMSWWSTSVETQVECTTEQFLLEIGVIVAN